jgi:crotonobetainyl-CoA:carnitine CoA-transferase CaiB-like acyl-CoA transferase
MGESLDGTLNSDYYASLNRNKRSISIDLQAAAGADLARKLAAVSDVVVQNFRPGIMDKLGLGFPAIAPLRTGLVYCSISAFGNQGPWRDKPANDIIMQGVSGLMDLTGEPDGDPVRVGTAMCDYATGLFALSAVLAALFARDSHPDGQHVEVNMFDSTIAMMANYVPAILSLGRTIARQGRGHAQLVPYQAFRCGDDQYLIVGAFTDAFWRRLCESLRLNALLTDPRFATNPDRLKNRGELVPVLEKVFASRPREEWMNLLEAADVPVTPVFTLAEALRSEQAKANQTVVELPDTEPPLFAAGLPVRAGGWPSPPRQRPPSIGADTALVLKDALGLGQAEIDSLVTNEVVGLDR